MSYNYKVINELLKIANNNKIYPIYVGVLDGVRILVFRTEHQATKALYNWFKLPGVDLIQCYGLESFKDKYKKHRLYELLPIDNSIETNLEILKENGFHPIAYCQYMFEHTFFFNTKKESMDAFYLCEQRFQLISAFYYGIDDAEDIKVYEQLKERIIHVK